MVVAAGWKPGWSTDYCATLLAKMYNSRTVVNMSNIEMVYTDDPKKNPKATPIERTTWNYFRRLVGSEWKPGMNVPWDPIAAKEADEIGLSVIILKGNNIRNLEKLLIGKRFKGTVISPFRLDASFYNKQYYEDGIGYKGYTTSILGRLAVNIANLYRALTIRIFLNPKSVLDVGCATGLLVRYLRMLGVDAKGVDVSKYAISRADKKTRKYLKQADILDLPYDDRSFDLVVTFNILEHIETDRLKEAIDECCRVSRKFCLHKIFTIENSWVRMFHGSDLSHISVFNKNWWEKLFKDNKYNIAKKYFLNLGEKMETIYLLLK